MDCFTTKLTDVDYFNWDSQVVGISFDLVNTSPKILVGQQANYELGSKMNEALSGDIHRS